MMDTVALLAGRGKTHGEFADTARIAHRIKDVMLDECLARIDRGQAALTPEHRETLDMIAMKVARIISGDPDFSDHWDDIAGYAKLCSKPPEKVVEPPLVPRYYGNQDNQGAKGYTPISLTKVPVGGFESDDGRVQHATEIDENGTVTRMNT